MAFLNNFELNTTATVKRISVISDGMGGNTKTTSTIDTIKCAIWLTGSYEKYQSDRIHNPGNYTLVCFPSTKYLASDKVIVGKSTYRMSQPDNVINNEDVMVIFVTLDG